MSNLSPKQTDVVRLLRSRIIRGTYAGRIPSGRILARDLGASVSTIDLALSELRLLGMVRREARHGTFVVPPEERKKAGAALTARVVCTIPPDLSPPAFWNAGIIFGFERACFDREASMVLHYAGRHGEADAAVEYALASGGSGSCLGTCLLGVYLETRHALALKRAAAPVVAVDWEFEEPLIPTVSFDNLEAGALIAKHLVSQGHKRIAYLGQPQAGPSERDRMNGAAKVLAAKGLPAMQRVQYPSGVDLILALSLRPTAVIAHAALYAEFLMAQAAAAGIRVPQDLSVATFHDPRCQERPGITVAALDFDALGRRALEALLDEELWKNPAPRLVPVDRVVGNTTAPPRD